MVIEQVELSLDSAPESAFEQLGRCKLPGGGLRIARGCGNGVSACRCGRAQVWVGEYLGLRHATRTDSLA
jgi:hypothetical protein